MKSFTSILAVALSAVTIAAAVRVPDVCVEGTSKLINSTMSADGKEATVHSCKTNPDVPASAGPASADSAVRSGLVRRNMNLCGAPCTTYCNSGSGGPNPNDCSALASSFANQGGLTLTPGETYYWSLGSCQAYMNDNLSGQDIYYCFDYSNWAGVVNYLAWNCQGTQGDNGGSCHFYDNTGISWLQVQTS